MSSLGVPKKVGVTFFFDSEHHMFFGPFSPTVFQAVFSRGKKKGAVDSWSLGWGVKVEEDTGLGSCQCAGGSSLRHTAHRAIPRHPRQDGPPPRFTSACPRQPAIAPRPDAGSPHGHGLAVGGGQLGRKATVGIAGQHSAAGTAECTACFFIYF